MIDANSISNLQMLMNTGDGRHAVIAELLQFGQLSKSSNAGFLAVKMDAYGIPPVNEPRSENFEILGPHVNRLQLQPRTTDTNAVSSRLSDDIIATLDNLSKEDKKPLIKFAEGLAYYYNNLFMAIVGYITIVMSNLKPSHPSYDRLLDCEELIHNTALLIRLLVDVFHRSHRAGTTVYPIDLSDREIIGFIFRPNNNTDAIANYSNSGLNVEKILKIVSVVMARRLKRTFLVLQSQISYSFLDSTCRELRKDYELNIQLYLKKGINISKDLFFYAENDRIKNKYLKS